MTDEGVLRVKKLLLVGNLGDVHVGTHLNQAAKTLGLHVTFLNSMEAFAGPTWLVRFNWLLRGHCPCKLPEFTKKVVKVCKEFQPKWMLSTGLAPIEASALEAIGKLGIQRLNYLTDDPWNPAHQAPWFMKALPLYDHVFSPRRSNLDDIRQLGCKKVSYLPFAYAPELHFSEPPDTTEEQVKFNTDVVFAGGADRERIPFISVLIQTGFKVGLYGGYWERFKETKKYTRGHVDPHTLRKAISRAKVVLCLVRRANRDGHCMRTFEVPAIGACMLTEDTEEHREILGNDGECVIYFRTIPEMIKKLQWLLENEDERRRLAETAHHLIVSNGNTYCDRLRVMIGLAIS